jgi:hypothetical protein
MLQLYPQTHSLGSRRHSRRKRKSKPYSDREEISRILNKYRRKLYVFVAPADTMDLHIRDKVAVALVRIAQAGNLLAKVELVGLLRYTIEGWLDSYSYMSRWRGHDDEIRERLEGVRISAVRR